MFTPFCACGPVIDIFRCWGLFVPFSVLGGVASPLFGFGRLGLLAPFSGFRGLLAHFSGFRGLLTPFMWGLLVCASQIYSGYPVFTIKMHVYLNGRLATM